MDFFFLALPCKNIFHLVVVTECSMALRHDPILHFPFFVSFLFSFDLKCFQFLFFGLNQLGVVVDCQSESMSRHSMFPSRRKDGEVIPSVACRPFPIITIRSEDIASSLSPNTVCSRSDAHPINGRSNSSIPPLSLLFFFSFFSFYRGENGQED